MKNFQLIATDCDVTPLLLQIKQQPDLWKADTFLRNYPQGPFGEVESIMLRFPKQEVFTGRGAARKLELYKANKLPGHDQHESINRPEYARLPEARKIVMNLMARVGGERLGRVLLNKIGPGGKIFPHADSPEHASYWDRFHVVLQSMDGVTFRAGDEVVYMPPGSVWWFQNLEEHEVLNESPIDRIHLVIDIRTHRQS